MVHSEFEAVLYEIFRYAIAYVFLIAALSKLRSLTAFQEKLADIVNLKRLSIVGISVGIIATETCVVALLLATSQTNYIAFCALATLVGIYSVYIAASIIGKSKNNCNCFGSGQNKIINFGDLIRNIIILGMTFFCLLNYAQSLQYKLDNNLLTVHYCAAIIALMLVYFSDIYWYFKHEVLNE